MVEKGGLDDDGTNINSSRLVVIANSTLLDPIPTKLNIEFVINSINQSNLSHHFSQFQIILFPLMRIVWTICRLPYILIPLLRYYFVEK